jgi:hypothetical protein
VDNNAEDSILRNNEPDSIETDERDLQPLKQEEPIISTVCGMNHIMGISIGDSSQIRHGDESDVSASLFHDLDDHSPFKCPHSR